MKIVYDSILKDNICIADEELISVTAVEARSDYSLLLTFSTGEIKIFNALPLLDKKVFQPLKNVNLFLAAKVDYGTVVWNEDIDISPEKLYFDSVLVR